MFDTFEKSSSQVERKDLSLNELRESNTVNLIDHIINRYHRAHLQQLDELLLLSERVEHVHSDEKLVPKGLHYHLTLMHQDLRQHMQKEEQILFPVLIDENWSRTIGPISVMQSDHMLHQKDIEKLSTLTHNFQLPVDACTSFKALYQLLQTFIQDLRTHIDIEDNVLFTRACPSA